MQRSGTRERPLRIPLAGATSSGLSIAPATCDPRQIRRGAAIRQHERRSEERLFQRRHHRGDPRRAGATAEPESRRAHVGVRVQGQGRDLRKVGDALDVATVLEGSVQQSGDEVRITAQLIDTRSGYHLWSEKIRPQTHQYFRRRR